jgi:hypothetical protein
MRGERGRERETEKQRGKKHFRKTTKKLIFSNDRKMTHYSDTWLRRVIAQRV